MFLKNLTDQKTSFNEIIVEADIASNPKGVHDSTDGQSVTAQSPGAIAIWFSASNDFKTAGIGDRWEFEIGGSFRQRS